MQTFTDQMGNLISLPYPPKRIISLVPSQTELLFDLGLEAEIAGRTKFCIHPKEKVSSVQKVGGTKDFKLDLIREFQPDLIIGNKEENEQAKIEALQKEFPVWMSDISDLESALQMIGAIGELVGKSMTALHLVEELTASFRQLKTANIGKNQKVLYLIWRKPYMAAGVDTFINEMLRACNFQNAVSATRYPEVSETEIAALRPDRIFLSSEPFPFKEKHIEELRAICPNANIQRVDGELFSWYGSRLLKAPGYFLKAFAKHGFQKYKR